MIHALTILLLALIAGLASPTIIQAEQVGDETQHCASRSRGTGTPVFSDYPTEQAVTARPKPPVLVSARDRLYRTRIKEAAAKGPNFAGHYSVAEWGCGTACHQLAIVDLNTGKVYDTSFREVDYHTPTEPNWDPEWWCYPQVANYQIGSRLLIVEGCLDGKQCGRNYYSIEPSGLRYLKHDPDLSKDGTVAPF